jgi:hypothetical protein
MGSSVKSRVIEHRPTTAVPATLLSTCAPQPFPKSELMAIDKLTPPTHRISSKKMYVNRKIKMIANASFIHISLLTSTREVQRGKERDRGKGVLRNCGCRRGGPRVLEALSTCEWEVENSATLRADPKHWYIHPCLFVSCVSGTVWLNRREYRKVVSQSNQCCRHVLDVGS